jgi:hypothetical protein
METPTNRIKNTNQIECLKEFNDYAIDTDGNVWSYKNNKTIKLKTGWAKSRDGYRFVMLANNNGKKKSFYVHRLVALAFIPTDTNKKRVKHLNGDITDNRVENLDWIQKGKPVNKDVGYELRLDMSKRIKEIHTASVRKGVSISSSYDFMHELIDKAIQDHVRQYGLQKILYQMNQSV